MKILKVILLATMSICPLFSQAFANNPAYTSLNCDGNQTVMFKYWSASTGDVRAEPTNSPKQYFLNVLDLGENKLTLIEVDQGGIYAQQNCSVSPTSIECEIDWVGDSQTKNKVTEKISLNRMTGTLRLVQSQKWRRVDKVFDQNWSFEGNCEIVTRRKF